jgi:hypothetical protein
MCLRASGFKSRLPHQRITASKRDGARSLGRASSALFVATSQEAFSTLLMWSAASAIRTDNTCALDVRREATTDFTRIFQGYGTSRMQAIPLRMGTLGSERGKAPELHESRKRTRDFVASAKSADARTARPGSQRPVASLGSAECALRPSKEDLSVSAETSTRAKRSSSDPITGMPLS